MDRLVIKGTAYRVEANFNAIMSFAGSRGYKSLDFLAGELSIQDWVALMAAAINEGERLEGRDHAYTVEDFGDLSFTAMAKLVQQFIVIFTAQNEAEEDGDEAKKKNPETA